MYVNYRFRRIELIINPFQSSIAEFKPKIIFNIGDYVRFHSIYFSRINTIITFDYIDIYRYIFIVLTELL